MDAELDVSPSPRTARKLHSFVGQRRAGDVAARLPQRLAVVCDCFQAGVDPAKDRAPFKVTEHYVVLITPPCSLATEARQFGEGDAEMQLISLKAGVSGLPEHSEPPP